MIVLTGVFLGYTVNVIFCFKMWSIVIVSNYSWMKIVAEMLLNINITQFAVF